MNEEENNQEELVTSNEPAAQEQQVVAEEPKDDTPTGNNKKGGNKVVIIIMGIIIVALLAVVLILLLSGNDKNKNNENKNEENTENTEVDPTPEPSFEELDVDSEEVNNVFSRFSMIAITEEELYQDIKYDINNISNSDLIMTALKSLAKTEYEPTACSQDSKKVSISYLNERLATRIINKKVDYTLLNDMKGKIVVNDKVWGPDNYTIVDNENIEVRNTLCGSLASDDDFILEKTIKAEKQGDIINIYQKKAFARYDSFSMAPDDMVSFYLDYSRNGDKIETIKDPHYNGDFHNTQLKWDLYNTYKYTFKLIDGEYYFQSFELVK